MGKPSTELTVGFYKPTKRFHSITEHVAVMTPEGGLIAVTGPSDPRDPNSESHLAAARLFAASNRMLTAIEFALSVFAPTACETSERMALGFLEAARVAALNGTDCHCGRPLDTTLKLIQGQCEECEALAIAQEQEEAGAQAERDALRITEGLKKANAEALACIPALGLTGAATWSTPEGD